MRVVCTGCCALKDAVSGMLQFKAALMSELANVPRRRFSGRQGPSRVIASWAWWAEKSSYRVGCSVGSAWRRTACCVWTAWWKQDRVWVTFKLT